jgi:putative oxidoreductase
MMKEPFNPAAECRHDTCRACVNRAMAWVPPGVREVYGKIASRLDALAATVPPLFLRLMLAYEFGEAGWMKWHSENWFADLAFPFPFGLLPPGVNWWLATGFETVGAAALVLGLATRFFSFALMVLTVVAIASVHWPSEWSSFADLLQGYSITDHGHGNYKLPLIYLVMFLPLLFGGAGKFSLDTWIAGASATAKYPG